ncbi:hypothetical protein CDL12_13582 [Handroanthus impetiginosus]|uniref:PGG domain-containing protein n=1 Tax=Handroanthus impetiginosus TaxID=429701 RepID=A0A2G9H8J4_9LAMI|nr:hypothetical protein CDL12_13582 [Handroanthus impetiginosus]
MAGRGHGQKWQIDIERNNEIDTDKSNRESAEVSSTSTTRQPQQEGNEDQTWKGNRSIGVRSKFHKLMYKAAMKGDWQAAEILVRQDRDVVSAKITERGERALHVAVAMKQKKFVRELVQQMTPSELALQNEHGQTALFYAAAVGIVEMAVEMREKSDNLVTMSDKNEKTPLYIATRHGNKDMVSYLYKFTCVKQLQTKQWFDIIYVAIDSKMYDVALRILRENKSLAAMTHEKGIALHLLARQKISNTSAKQEAILERLKNMFDGAPYSSWVTKIFEELLMQKKAGLLAKVLWDDIQRSEETYAVELINKCPILHDAAKVGNVGLIIMLARSDPDLLFKFDEEGHSIFHIAVLYRQEIVFSLVHRIGIMKDFITKQIDPKGNNILHLAGELAHPQRRNIVYGPALQMRLQLIWFKEVERIVPPDYLEMKNSDGYTPRELFSKNHQELLEEGKTWMKDTANSLMLVATLIITVAFAAAFTAPGGYNDETGIPLLVKRSLFPYFQFGDGGAFYFSILSTLMFLSILTSRFQEDDFLQSLPAKLHVGLATLYLALYFTIVAFTSALQMSIDGTKESPSSRMAVVLLANIFILVLGILKRGLLMDLIPLGLYRFIFSQGKSIF